MRRPRTRARDVVQAIMDQMRNERVDHAVVAFSPVLARSYQLEMAQKRELVTHRRHRQPERMRQITHAELIVRKRMYEAQTEGIGEREKNFDRFFRGTRGRKISAKPVDFFSVFDVWKRHLHS